MTSAVTLPHTWNAIDGQDGGNDYWRGTAVYEKTFPRPELEPGGRAVLEFLGAAMAADVSLNGQHLACHEGGFSTFRVKITDALEDENLAQTGYRKTPQRASQTRPSAELLHAFVHAHFEQPPFEIAGVSRPLENGLIVADWIAAVKI